MLVRSGGITGTVLTTRMIDDTLYIVAEQNVWCGEDLDLPEISVNGENASVEATAISYDPDLLGDIVLREPPGVQRRLPARRTASPPWPALPRWSTCRRPRCT